MRIRELDCKVAECSGM